MNLSSTVQPKKIILSNGLTVILDENHASPVVSLNVGVGVGSVWESPDEGGLSHVLEHMVFKGTKSTEPGEIATTVEACGGELNAYTSLDQTVYYINLASRHLATGLHLLCEMVFEAKIDELELEREKEVILEEISRGKDSPSREISENLFSLAFQVHPYGRPVIGTPELVKSFSQQKVMQFYKHWYTPSNMVLVITGDFNEKELLPLIDRLFGHYQDTPIVRPHIVAEPLPEKPRWRSVTKDVEGIYLQISYPVPSINHEDIPALDLLSHLLGEGHTSRLEQNVKEKKGVVNSVGSYCFTPKMAGLFGVHATIPLGKLDEAMESLDEEIEHIKNHCVSMEALQRSRLILKSSVYYEKETCEGSARKWMTYELIAGDMNYEEKYLASLDSITPQTLRSLARKYLDTKYRCVVVLQKKHVTLSAKKQKAVSSKLATCPPQAKLVESWENLKKFRLKNGMTLLCIENHRLPIMSVYLSGLGGLRAESKKHNGISQLMTAVLNKGTLSRNALKIAEINEAICGHVSAFAGRNSWGLSSTFLSEKMDMGLDLFTDTLLNPAFLGDEIKKEKRLLLESIRSQEDSPAHVAFLEFQKTLFKKHPYGLPLNGTRQTVQSITRKDLIDFYKKHLDPSQMVIAAVGNFDTEELVSYFSETVGILPVNKKALLKLAAEKPVLKKQSRVIRKNKMQAHLVLGYLGSTITAKDRYAVEVLTQALSGQGGRLFLELRDKQSLCYTVSPQNMEGLEPGFFSVYMGTDPSKLDDATRGIRLELEKISQTALSEEELDRTKNYIIGNYEIDLQKNSSIASTLALNELYGVGYKEFRIYAEKIQAVTAADVQKVAKKYIRPQSEVMVVVKP